MFGVGIRLGKKYLQALIFEKVVYGRFCPEMGSYWVRRGDFLTGKWTRRQSDELDKDVVYFW